MAVISRAAIAVARLCLSGWVVAAVLFVVNGIRLVGSPHFSAAQRDYIALIRFPGYYACGVTLLTVALVCVVIAGFGSSRHRVRLLPVAAAVLTALAVMAIDYTQIYQPLVAEMTPAGQPRTGRFGQLHQQSEQINTLMLLISLTAAGVLNWPMRVSEQRTPNGPRTPKT